jgi:hypothetical protein
MTGLPGLLLLATEFDARVRRAVVAKLMGHSRERHRAPYLQPDGAAVVKALPVPANFTTLVEGWEVGLESDRGQVQVPRELVMVGPWGLEPQTSTVSILKMVIARTGTMMRKGTPDHRLSRIFTGVPRLLLVSAFSCP